MTPHLREEARTAVEFGGVAILILGHGVNA